MRPIKLCISAFGPYASSVIIEMDRLGNKGLYLITGDTGAGKTTIFDAITYALYGSTSGGSREPKMMRSKYADPQTPTEVELTFEYAGNEYRIKRNPDYERPAKKGEGMTVEKSSAELVYPDGRVITKPKEVDTAVREIMGIDKNQFSQIAMIAQGDFLKLLLAKTEDRQDIFRQIFKTGYFQKFQDRLSLRSRELKAECDAFRSQLRQYISSILCNDNNDLVSELASIQEILGAKDTAVPTERAIELLKKIISSDKEFDVKAGVKLQSIESILLEINNSLAKEAERIKKVELLDSENKKLLEKQAVLEKIKSELEVYKEKQSETEKIDMQIALIEAQYTKYDEIQSRLSEYIKADNDIKLYSADLVKVKSLQKKCSDILDECEKKKKDIQTINTKISDQREKYRLLEKTGEEFERLKADLEREENKKEAVLKLRNDVDTYKLKCKEWLDVQNKYKKAYEAEQTKKSVYELKNRAFLDEQAGILADGLSEGQRCPVCGSLEHPLLAVKSDEAPTENEVKKLKEDADRASESTAKLSSESGEIKGQVLSLRTTIHDQIKQLDIRSDLSVEDMKEYIKSGIDNAITEYLNNINIKSEQIKKRITEVLDMIKQRDTIYSDIEIKEKQMQNLTSEIEKLTPENELKLKEYEKKISDSEVCRASAEVKKSEIVKQITDLKESLSFEKREQADKYRNQLLTQKKDIKEAAENAQKKYIDCQNECSVISGTLKTLSQQIESYEKADTDKLKTIKSENDILKDKLIRQQKEIYTRISTNESIIKNIINITAEQSGSQNEYIQVKALSDTAAGTITGKEKIMLETYVQMSYFERIIKRANTRLIVMTGGQYELIRRNEADDKRGQRGLDLDVIDHYNGSQRNVRTLSGGESFKASLALALGLSEEIQSSAGGIRLDTMFVDEGFGSLDEESLQQAIKSLSDLSEGNRLVGIISHVSELKEKIERQIVVTKDKSGGSKVELVI